MYGKQKIISNNPKLKKRIMKKTGKTKKQLNIIQKKMKMKKKTCDFTIYPKIFVKHNYFYMKYF